MTLPDGHFIVTSSSSQFTKSQISPTTVSSNAGVGAKVCANVGDGVGGGVGGGVAGGEGRGALVTGGGGGVGGAKSMPSGTTVKNLSRQLPLASTSF